MLVIFRPQAFSARTADSRPGPGPLTRTSTIFTPCSCAAVPAFSAATCAANGVLLREPRNPQPPEVAHDSVLPWRSVIVTIVLLKDACTCAIASVTCFLTFLRPFPAAPCPCFCSAICLSVGVRIPLVRAADDGLPFQSRPARIVLGRQPAMGEPSTAISPYPEVRSSSPPLCAGPGACERSCACVVRATAIRGDDGCRGSSPDPSGA